MNIFVVFANPYLESFFVFRFDFVEIIPHTTAFISLGHVDVQVTVMIA